MSAAPKTRCDETTRLPGRRAAGSSRSRTHASARCDLLRGHSRRHEAPLPEGTVAVWSEPGRARVLFWCEVCTRPSEWRTHPSCDPVDGSALALAVAVHVVLEVMPGAVDLALEVGLEDDGLRWAA